MPYVEVLQRYAQFGGRAARSEFWPFILLHAGIAWFLAALAALSLASTGWLFGALVFVYLLATLLPWIGVMLRRLHDIGRSGWWILIGLVPIVSIVLLVFALLPSQGDNGHGAPPDRHAAQLDWIVGIAGLALAVVAAIIYMAALNRAMDPYSGF